MKTFEIRSTFLGYVSMIFWGLFWSILIFALNQWMTSYVATVEDAVDRRFLAFLIWIISLVVPITAVCVSYATFYGLFRVTSFHSNIDGNCHKVSKTEYGFPFSKHTSEAIFDRIVRVKVEQSSIGRMLNTGNLTLTLVTFTNADVIEKEWEIPAIKNPYQYQEDIMSQSPKHEGLDVRLKPSSVAQ